MPRTRHLKHRKRQKVSPVKKHGTRNIGGDEDAAPVHQVLLYFLAYLLYL